MEHPDYVIKCFIEAFAIKGDFETMGYLNQLYIPMEGTEKVREPPGKVTVVEPHVASTFLTLADICYTQEDYKAMEEAAGKAITIEEGNTVAHFLLGKTCKGQDDRIMTTAHLTRAIILKDDLIETCLMRAEALLKTKQYRGTMEDMDTTLTQNPREKTVILLRGEVKEANRQEEEAETDYKSVTETNPFNKQAYLYLGQLYINQGKLAEAIALFDEATELNPNSTEAYRECGCAELLNDDKDDPIEDMRKSLELNPRGEASPSGEFRNLGSKPEALSGVFQADGGMYSLLTETSLSCQVTPSSFLEKKTKKVSPFVCV